MLVESGGEGSSCLLSLSALVLSAVWMVLPFPAPCLWGLFVFFVFYIKAPGLVPTTPPIPALRLIYLSLQMWLLCFQPLLLQYP